MFKIEITKDGNTINKVSQNKIDDDWVRYLLDTYEVRKEDIKIFWIKGLDKNNYKKTEISLDKKSKVERGKKITNKLSGDKFSKKEYNDFVDRLDAGGVINKADYKRATVVKQHATKSDLYTVKDRSLFNKEWFIRESEYQLILLRWPYDSNMNFIGFDFDPSKA